MVELSRFVLTTDDRMGTDWSDGFSGVSVAGESGVCGFTLP